MSDIALRIDGKASDFNTRILWDNAVADTLRAGGNAIRAYDKCATTDIDHINMQTFPQDYDFNGESVNYICGMSVPPVMIKRLITRLIQTGVFSK